MKSRPMTRRAGLSLGFVRLEDFARRARSTNLREKWLREFNVDIAIPRAFYRDLLVYAPAPAS